MMLKRALLAAEPGESLFHVITPGEGVKTASHIDPAIQRFIDTLRPDPRYTYVLAVAMGNSQYYGPNSNRDWYGYNPHLDFDGLVHAWPEIGQDYEADKMKGRDLPYGYPTFYGATVYAHHKNTDPQQLGFGDVIFAHYNPEMKRVELVERIFNDEATKKGHDSIIDRILAGERVDQSMGCKIPWDACSICTDWERVKDAWRTFDPKLHKHPGIAVLQIHKKDPIRGIAVTRAEYCEDMKQRPGKVLPDGRKVFVYNDFCRFFDISFVLIGADRTARVMWFLGEARKSPGPDTSLADLFRKVGEVRLAAMEKEIPEGTAEAVRLDAESAPDSSDLFGNLASRPDRIRVLLTVLAARGIVASPEEFQSLVLGSSPEGKLMKSAMDRRGLVFAQTGGLSDDWSVDPGLYDTKLAEDIMPLCAERSVFSHYLTPRLKEAQKHARGHRKTAHTEATDKLSAAYNGYRISILEHASRLFPKTAGYSISPAALLLGQAPVIGLISSHLKIGSDNRRDIATMSAPFQDPSFAAVEKVGHALRAAMVVDSRGGIGHAASAAVAAAKKIR